jgi:chromosome segregation ATPase
MNGVETADIAALVFAAAVVVATGGFVAALLDRIGRRLLVALDVLLAAAAAGTWVLFALEPGRDRAVSAAGATVAAALGASALAVARMRNRVGGVDAQLDRAKSELEALVAHEVETRSAELERVLARARADSISQLVEEERRIADERRREVAEREREATEKLSESLTGVRQRLEQRLTSWAGDLERSQHGLAEDLTKLGQRQRQRMDEIDAKIERDTETLQSSADDQKALAARLRQELERIGQEVTTAAASELEAHAAERRRALHEVAERLRKRERDLMEMIERETANAAERVQVSVADVERRQVEQLERVVQREAARYAEAASQQFDGQIRTAREDAAKRLGRELDLAVERFAREAQQVLAERMAHVGNQGAETIDRRLTQLRSGIEQERDAFFSELERRVQEIEAQLRERMADLTSDAEAERLVIEARLHDVSRRVDDLVARAEAQLR